MKYKGDKVGNVIGADTKWLEYVMSFSLKHIIIIVSFSQHAREAKFSIKNFQLWGWNFAVEIIMVVV